MRVQVGQEGFTWAVHMTRNVISPWSESYDSNDTTESAPYCIFLGYFVHKPELRWLLGIDNIEPTTMGGNCGYQLGLIF
jgi:hypothetical protein